MQINKFVSRHIAVEAQMLAAATPCHMEDTDSLETAQAILAGEVVQICGGPGMFKHWTRDIEGETIVVGRAEIVAVQQRVGVAIALRQDPQYQMQMQIYFENESRARDWIATVSSTLQVADSTPGD